MRNEKAKQIVNAGREGRREGRLTLGRRGEGGESAQWMGGDGRQEPVGRRAGLNKSRSRVIAPLQPFCSLFAHWLLSLGMRALLYSLP